MASIDKHRNVLKIPSHSKLEKFLDSRFFHLVVLGFILVNAIVIGLETSQEMLRDFGDELFFIEYTILGLFVVEVFTRILVFGGKFFHKGWNVFDFVVISVSLLPHGAGLSILRLFRVIYALSLFEVSPHMRHLLQALRHVGPSVVNVSFFMIIAFYILGVIGVELFSEHFPKQFGNLPWSIFTLFRLMVYDDYGVITRPILEAYPFAWIYFLMITLILAFVLINLFVAIVVTALQRAIETEKDPVEAKVKQEMKILTSDTQLIQELKSEIQALRKLVSGLKKS